MANKVLPTLLPYTTAIPFDQPVTVLTPHTVSGALTFTKVTAGAEATFCALLRLTANGTNEPDFSAFSITGTGAYDNTNGVVNQCWFFFDGVDYCVSFTQPGVVVDGGGGGGGTPLNAPTGVGTSSDDSSITITWTDTNTSPNETSYLIQMGSASDYSDATTIVTTAANAVTYTKTGLASNTLKYFRIKAKGNGTTTADSAYVNFNETTTLPVDGGLNIMSGWTAMDFTNNTSLTNPSEGIYKSSGSASFSGWGLEPGRAPIYVSGSGQDCGIAFYFDGTLGAKLGFKSDGIKSDDFDYAIRTGATNLMFYDIPTGGITTGPTLVVGTHYGIFRESGVWVVRSSTDAGATWSSVLYTFLSNVSAINALHEPVGCSVYGDTPYALTFPQKKGLT